MVDRGRVILAGKCNAGEEQWTMSFALPALNSFDEAEGQAAVEAIRDAFQTNVWSTGVDVFDDYISDHTAWDSVTLNDIQDPGVTFRQWVAFSDGTGQGGFGGNPLPSQISTVVSLHTGFPGASKRGRMYFPPFGVSAGTSNARVASACVTALTSAMVNFFQDVNAIAGLAVNVYSTTVDQLTPVTQVRVGDVFDTQRRRRNELVEAYTIGNL